MRYAVEALRRTALGSTIFDRGARVATVEVPDLGAAIAFRRYWRHDDFALVPIDGASALPSSDPAPHLTDDLTELPQCGPELARLLNEMGIRTCHQLAAILQADSSVDRDRLIALPGITARRLEQWRQHLEKES